MATRQHVVVLDLCPLSLSLHGRDFFSLLISSLNSYVNSFVLLYPSSDLIIIGTSGHEVTQLTSAAHHEPVMFMERAMKMVREQDISGCIAENHIAAGLSVALCR